MSVLSVPAPRGALSPARIRLGQPDAADGSTRWVLRRNCSMAPRQLFAIYASLCAVSLVVAGLCWQGGATLVLPFTGTELLFVGVALLVYARRATDRETLVVGQGTLRVECLLSGRTEAAEFAAAWVRIEPHRDASELIEISGQGRRIAVGRFVRPELRCALADELQAAVRRCGAA